jgi:hypothetical protein
MAVSLRRKDIREFIVDRFRNAKKPLTFEEVAQQMNVSRRDVEKKLRDSEPLSNFRGLTQAKALKVMEFYGDGVIFSAELEWLIREGRKSEDRLKQFARGFRQIKKARAKTKSLGAKRSARRTRDR